MKKDVCKICLGNDYYIDEDNRVHQCPECTYYGKDYEPQEIENETRTETLYPINS